MYQLEKQNFDPFFWLVAQKKNESTECDLSVQDPFLVGQWKGKSFDRMACHRNCQGTGRWIET